MNAFELLLTDALLLAYAAALGIAGMAIVFRCVMHNFNPERVSMPSVVKHTLVSMLALFLAGMLCTASRLPEGASIGYIVDIGLGLSLPLVLVAMLLSVAPPMLAMRERRHEAREAARYAAYRGRQSYMLRTGHDQPWSLTPAA